MTTQGGKSGNHYLNQITPPCDLLLPIALKIAKDPAQVSSLDLGYLMKDIY